MNYKAFCQDDSTHFNKLSIGIHGGILNYFGDVSNNNSNTKTSSKLGIQFPRVEYKISNSLDLSYSMLIGKVYGDEKSETRQLNFQSSINAQALALNYDFSNFIGEKALIKPRISFGFSLLSFRTKGDLKSSNGSTYFYWADGTIRDKAENDISASSASIIERDHVYESNLRDLNLDKVGKYKQYCIAFPLDLGIKIRISDIVGANIGCSYIIPTSDYMDNISAESLGNRKGDSKNDKLVYAYAGFIFKIKIPKQNLVSETNTSNPEIPKEKVISEEPKKKEVKQDSKPAEKPKAEIKAEPKPKPSLVPENLKIFDIDKDDYISSQEVNTAIDRFFDSKGTATIKDIEKLKDFFKKQPAK